MKKIVSLVSLVLLLCAVMGILPALAEGEDPTTLEMSIEEVILATGKSKDLSDKWTLTPRAAKKAGVTFASTDEEVATVSKQGYVKAIGLGECQIIITSKYDETVSVSIPVTVVVPVKKISLSAETKKIYIGQTLQLTAELSPEDATLPMVTYVSEREKVATVDENGLITGVGKGYATIKATSRDGYARREFQVQVLQPAESVTLSPEEKTVFAGKSFTLKATVNPSSANNKNVTWSSNNEAVATVNRNGRVSALKLGTATITATSADGYALGTAVVHVTQPAESVAFDNEEAEVLIGETLQLHATVLPANTSDKSVTYKSGNKRIATVDENGVVTGLKGGSTTITVTTADGSKKSARIKVTVIVPVEGVSFSRPAARVGVDSYIYVTATLSPKDATNHNMTWTIDDSSIATVKGTTNKVRVSGKRWGQTVLRGTTEDGGYTTCITINVGSLNKAVTIESLSLDAVDCPVITLKNRSNMTLKNIQLGVYAYDEYGDPISLSTTGGELVIVYEPSLYAGEKSNRYQFTLKNYIYNHEKIYDLQVAVLGWECTEGYMTNQGATRYSYTIDNDSLDWKEIAIN